MGNMRYLLILMLSLFTIAGQAEPVVLVTGASRGIGFTTVRHLASLGYRVYAGVRCASAVESLWALKQSFPGRIEVVSLDVTDDQSVQSAVAHLLAKEGHIDALVNNAGIMAYGSVENHTIAEAQAIFEVNFFGAMRVTQAVLPAMRAQKSGRIVQISSRSGFRPLPTLSIYAASKFALEGLSETMAASLKPWNIFVSLIEPGPVNTELDFASPYASRFQLDQDPYRPIFEASGLLDPYNPLAQGPEEIAAFVQKAIESECPQFRYQTTKAIEAQAGKRFVDITGLSAVSEWDAVLFPSQHSNAHPTQNN